MGREERGKGGIGAKDAGKELFNISFLSLSAEMCKLNLKYTTGEIETNAK